MRNVHVHVQPIRCAMSTHVHVHVHVQPIRCARARQANVDECACAYVYVHVHVHEQADVDKSPLRSQQIARVGQHLRVACALVMNGSPACIPVHHDTLACA